MLDCHDGYLEHFKERTNLALLEGPGPMQGYRYQRLQAVITSPAYRFPGGGLLHSMPSAPTATAALVNFSQVACANECD